MVPPGTRRAATIRFQTAQGEASHFRTGSAAEKSLPVRETTFCSWTQRRCGRRTTVPCSVDASRASGSSGRHDKRRPSAKAGTPAKAPKDTQGRQSRQRRRDTREFPHPKQIAPKHPEKSTRNLLCNYPRTAGHTKPFREIFSRRRSPLERSVTPRAAPYSPIFAPRRPNAERLCRRMARGRENHPQSYMLRARAPIMSVCLESAFSRGVCAAPFFVGCRPFGSLQVAPAVCRQVPREAKAGEHRTKAEYPVALVRYGKLGARSDVGDCLRSMQYALSPCIR